MELELLDKYILPFKSGGRVLEIGGGESPDLHPNMDARAIPGVDIVHDFNKLPLPVEDNLLNGVWQKYSLEHMSWRKIEDYIHEMYRILAPGGIFAALTANLYEQCKAIASKPEEDFTAEDISMIFGDQNYKDRDFIYNSHFVGWSPSFIKNMFLRCGFYAVKLYSFPIKTDLIIEAYRSNATIFYSLPQ